jgi:type III pantothenate kinase
MIDIGNTDTVLGLYGDSKLLHSWRLSSRSHRTEDEYWVALESFLGLQKFRAHGIKGVAISSVVPELTLIYQRMVEKYLHIDPLLISADLDLGMRVLYQDPYAVGADRLCNAVAGKDRYGLPLIIIDFGTATTFDCVDQAGDYLGGIICAGIESTASLLHQRAAKLPKIELSFPDKVIGINTQQSMQSGILIGTVKMIEGLIVEIRKELSGNPKVIATGGLAHIVSKRTDYIDRVDYNLNLEGIYLIYHRNRGRNP